MYVLIYTQHAYMYRAQFLHVVVYLIIPISVLETELEFKTSHNLPTWEKWKISLFVYVSFVNYSSHYFHNYYSYLSVFQSMYPLASLSKTLKAALSSASWFLVLSWYSAIRPRNLSQFNTPLPEMSHKETHNNTK